MPAYSIDGVLPVIHPSAFVHPTAVLIGDVLIGPHCYVGPCASLRGDFGRIIIEAGANVQDTCVMHGFPNGDTVVEENGHCSHGSVMHGCRVGRNSMIGINAVIMDNAVIGPECMVAALSYVPGGFEAPARSVIAGAPAVVKRTLSDDEVNWKTQGTELYQELAHRCRESLTAVEPLNNRDRKRLRIAWREFAPLGKKT